MRYKRQFINYKFYKFYKNYSYFDRAHTHYQRGANFNIITNNIVVSSNFRSQLLKVSRKLTKKSSFITNDNYNNYDYTTKPIGIRMGKGKGRTAYTIGVLSSGSSILTIRESSYFTAAKLYNLVRGRAKLTLTKNTY